jgi:selenocysteine lyase/cysteine desulfurase
MGERDHFISLEMASLGIERMAAWGCKAITERLAALTARLSDGLRSNRLDIPEADVRAPHILSIGFRDGMPERMIENLAAEQIYVAPRLGRIRVSPHVYNDEADIDRFVSAFRRLIPA